MASRQIASLLLFPAIAAAQVDTSNWKCELCPFESGYEADYTVGAIYVSDDAARFGDATGLDEKGVTPALDGDGRYGKDGFRAAWTVSDLAHDSREISVSAGRPGRYGMHAAYRERPQRQFDTTHSVFTAVGNDFLQLPAGWVASGTTGAMTGLPTSLRPANISADRTAYSLGGHYQAGSRFRFEADYRHEDREGVRIGSGPGFTQAALLPRLIDHSTDTIDLALSYRDGPLALSLSWYGSYFENGAASLTWENPFFDDPLTPGLEPNRKAVEPDNEFQQLRLSGSYRMDTADTVIAFSAASGQGTQDAALLDYTVNPDLQPVPLPRTSLDGKVDTRNYSFTLSSRPVEKGRLWLRYRFDERDNRTPVSTYTRVISDTFVSADPETNTPYSFERTRLSASAEYRLFDTLRISGGVERTELDRDFQEVAEQREDGGWLRGRWRPLDWLDVTVKGGSKRREIDRYDETIAASFGQNPLLRKYHLAHRFREFGEARVTLAPAEFPVSTTLSAMFSDDSFSQSRMGLIAAESSHVSIDLSWPLSDNASVFVSAGEERINADQYGSESFGEPDWSAFHRDRFRHYGAGIELRRITEQTSLVFDYLKTDGRTGIHMLRTGVSPSRYPDIDSRLTALRLSLAYRRSERLDIDLGLRYESFSSNDWALAGVAADTLPMILTLGAEPHDYNVWVVAIGFSYRVGPRDIGFPE